MDYPRIEINLSKLKHNVKTITDKCKENGIKVAGVTKVFCADKKLVKAYVDGGVSYLADSRLQNFQRLKDFSLPKILLRLPMISEAEEVVKYADASLNSEIETIRAISREAVKIGKKHEIILMVDLGDLREGYFYEDDLYKSAEEIKKLEGVELIGIGTNLTCYGGVIPTPENLGRLVEIKNNLEKNHDVKLKIISGGNSSSIPLLYDGTIPEGINNLRLGESLVLGRETAYGKDIEETFNDVFKLVIEAIEIKDKPSLPVGEIGKDAFGNVPVFEDKGIRKRMICAIGRQDLLPDDITPYDKEITVIGSSSDHLILDITNSKIKYKVGDKLEFGLKYGGILRGMTSEYVKKVYV
jgi:predicted amino acid racemase